MTRKARQRKRNGKNRRQKFTTERSAQTRTHILPATRHKTQVQTREKKWESKRSKKKERNIKHN